MTVDAVARNTAYNPPVEPEVRRAALGQLLKGGPLAESVHVVLVLVVAALVWDSLPLALTAGWVGAVTAAAGLRTWWRLGLSRRTASPEEALRGVRLTVAGVGLAWGFGAAAAIPALKLDEAALILVVLAGIVAGRRPGCRSPRRPAQLPLPPAHRVGSAAHRHPAARALPRPPHRDAPHRALRRGDGPGASAGVSHVRRASACRRPARIVHPGVGAAARLPRCPDREYARGHRGAGRPADRPQR